jgi:hypothetical protein
MRALCLVLMGLALATRGVAAEETRADEVLGFADHLYARGDYYRAITEYERFLFLTPSNAAAPQVKLQIAACYVQGKKWDTAIPLLLEVKEHCAETEAGKCAVFWLANAYYQMGSYNSAEVVLDEFERRQPASASTDLARLEQAACLLHLDNVTWAGEALARVPANSPARKLADDFAQSLRGYQELPGKSPWLAAGMSAVLPGAGQLYIRRPGDAAISFVLNGALIGATLAAFNNDERVAGSFILVFESSWYFGNIYNAASGAHKYNRRQRDTFFDQLQLKCGLFQPPNEPGRAGPAIGVGLRF